MENLHVKIENAGSELIIREGTALPQVEPQQVKITGDINTVRTFLERRRGGLGDAGQQKVDLSRAIVEVDRQKLQIILSLDPEYKYGTVVTAKLEPNPDLAQFHINGKKTFSQRELVDLLKFSRLYFEDYGKHGDLLKAYTAFSAKTTSDLASEKDNRGNKSYAFNKKVETGLPETFVMNVPIFKGQKPMRFMVQICLDVTDNAVAFWFESVELAEFTEIEGNTIIDEQLKSCEGFVIIYK